MKTKINDLPVKLSWRLTKEAMTTVSAPCPVLNNNPDSVFRSNDIVDEVVAIAQKLKLFEGAESHFLDDKVADFLIRMNCHLNRNKTGKNYWDGKYKEEELKKKYPEEFMVACVRALELLKWIWYDDAEVRFKTKIANIVENWPTSELCEVFGDEDADDIYDQRDNVRSAINHSYKVFIYS